MSLNRYLSNQVGQSPEDYVGAASPSRSKAAKPHDTGDPCDVESYYYDPNYCAQQGGTPYDSGQQGTGADTQDPCDQASAYYDPNYCQQYGGTIYNSGSGQPAQGQGQPTGQADPCDQSLPASYNAQLCSLGGGTPYNGASQGMDQAFCMNLAIVLPPPNQAMFQLLREDAMQLLAKGKTGSDMSGIYNNIQQIGFMQIPLQTPNGVINLPYRPVQVSATGDLYQDYYIDANNQLLIFADSSSQQWYYANLSQQCPSFLGLPTSQCQDIPGYECHAMMSGDSIMMGWQEVLGAASPATRILAKKGKISAPAKQAVSAKKRFYYKKLDAAGLAKQKARYRSGGNSRSKMQPISSATLPSAKILSTVSRPLAKSTSQRSRIPSKANRINRAVPSQAKTRILPYSANLPGTAVSGAAFQRRTGTPPYFPAPRKPPRGAVMGAPGKQPPRKITCVVRGQYIYCNGKKSGFLAP